MSGDGFEFEYPDEAGYPDGMGTLHEGTDETTSHRCRREAAGDAPRQPTGRRVGGRGDLEEFALDDEEDVDGNV